MEEWESESGESGRVKTVGVEEWESERVGSGRVGE